MSNSTKNAIAASFLKLLDERLLNKITVKDIVADCGVNRNSFYYHFQDVPSLICEIVSDEVNKIISEHPTVESFEECLRVAGEFFITKRKRAALHIYNSANRDIFQTYLLRICDYIVETYLSREFEARKIREEDKSVIVRFFKCELFGQITELLSGGFCADVIAMNERLCQLQRGMLDTLLSRCEIEA